MKKIFIPLLCLVWALCVQAQDKATRIRDIRKAYAEAKNDIAANGKSGSPRMDLRISVNGGTKVDENFIIIEETEQHYYFKRIHDQGKSDLFEPRCYFLTESTTANGHSVYREMLFDPLTSHLMFSFMNVETHAGLVIESRFYYDDEGHVIEAKQKAGDGEVTEQGWSSGDGDQTLAMVFLGLFDGLMQQKGSKTESYTPVQTADKAAQLTQIRSLYADAKQKIAKDEKSDVPLNMLIEIHDQEDPEMPPQKDELKFWYECPDDGTESRCYFISSTCQLGDHHVYSEYLFEPKTSRLKFCFSQQRQNDGPALEWRYYFGDDGRCIETKGLDARHGPGFADKKAAASYLEVFNAMVNPSY